MKPNKSIYILILFFIIISECSFSQVSGYMGKRFIAKFDTYTNLYLSLGLALIDISECFPVRKQIGADYIIGRKSTLGFTYDFGNTAFTDENTFGNIKDNGLGLSYTIYSGDDGIAPVGYFIKYKFDYIKSDYSINVLENYANPLGQWTTGKVRETGDINSCIAGVVMGQSGILFDRFYYNYGIQLGYRFGTLIELVAADDISVISSTDIKKDLINDARLRSFAHYSWGIQFGIGYMIF